MILREYISRMVRERRGRSLVRCLGAWVRLQRPASESRPYMGRAYNYRFCRVARLAARACGDLAKRARYIVPLHKEEKEDAAHPGKNHRDAKYAKGTARRRKGAGMAPLKRPASESRPYMGRAYN